jgi:hypothetical protein
MQVVILDAASFGTGVSLASLVQHTFMLMLALAGNLQAYQRDVKAGHWNCACNFCLRAGSPSPARTAAQPDHHPSLRLGQSLGPPVHRRHPDPLVV